MEKILKDTLATNILRPTGIRSGGCINEGESYVTDSGTVFVKRNPKADARIMFEGELEGLTALQNTRTIRVPKPITVVDDPKGGAALVMEYIEMKSCKKFQKQLGEKLAALHMHNIEILKHCNPGYVGCEEGILPVEKFGFHCTTCCGYIPMDNNWCEEWPIFFARNRLGHQIGLIERNYHDRDIQELWSQLQLKIPTFFEGLVILPSLLHGDLWSGNVAETDGEPILFDPAVFYGHHEFELSIATMFGGCSQTMMEAYHKIIPKANGFNTRQQLYQLFHYLNHWNHFGHAYRGRSLSIMRNLIK